MTTFEALNTRSGFSTLLFSLKSVALLLEMLDLERCGGKCVTLEKEEPSVNGGLDASDVGEVADCAGEGGVAGGDILG